MPSVEMRDSLAATLRCPQARGPPVTRSLPTGAFSRRRHEERVRLKVGAEQYRAGGRKLGERPLTCANANVPLHSLPAMDFAG